MRYIKEYSGVDLFVNQEITINKIKFFAQDKKIKNTTELLLKLKNDINFKQEFMNILTTNETYFFREENQLKEAVKFVKEKNDIKILCAPSSSGEEVFSLAILLAENNIENYKIIGIDINNQVISKAKKAQYLKRSLHKLDDYLKLKYFTLNSDSSYTVISKISNKVDFKVQNIFDKSFNDIGNFDIIFSRNMLIYFDNESRLLAIKKFFNLLNNDGKLYLGHADILPKNNFFKKSTEDIQSSYIKHV